MKIEELGKENEKIIVMLHGANFVHSFGKQYSLADTYHIIVPHIMGYGDEAGRVFETEACINELGSYIKGLGKKVYLVGFSLGAQLGFKLISDYPELFESAILISPWLIKEEPFFSKVIEMNLKQLSTFKNKFMCNLIGMMNGLPKVERKKFVNQMQNVKEETVRNAVDNKITLDSVPGFKAVSFPVIALAGVKEQAEVTYSIKKMAELNPNCRYEIWDKAAHNIPPLFADRLNTLIRSAF